MPPGSRALAALAVAAALLQGCASVSLYQAYEPLPGESSPLADALFVSVGPDERPFGGRSRLGPGFLALIPLIPYGHQQLAPEFGALGGAMTESDFPREVARTVVKDLRAARAARWVGFAQDRLPGEADPIDPVTLHVTLTQGIFHRNLTTYGVSLAGALLWLVGLPTSYGSAEIGLRAELVDAAGSSLGTREFSGKEGAVEWLYRSAGPSYTRALPEAYARISPGLRSFVRQALAARGARE